MVAKHHNSIKHNYGVHGPNAEHKRNPTRGKVKMQNTIKQFIAHMNLVPMLTIFYVCATLGAGAKCK